MEFTGTNLICPAGKPGAEPLVIDLEKILRAEQREEEVAMVTPMKAPELLREFNIAWRDLHKVVVSLASEQLIAERHLANREAVLTLEVVPGKLKELGIASNEANRKAVVTLDPEHQRLQETVDEIDGLVRYLKGKLTSFENAFSSVKKILGEDASWMQARTNNNLSGGAAPNKPVYASPAAAKAQTPAHVPAAAPTPARTGFGKSRV